MEPEYADATHVVLIATPFNTESDFVRLADAIDVLPVRTPFPAVPALPPMPPVQTSLRTAIFAPAQTVPLQAAVGSIAAEAACPCPPGIPIVMPGEEITADAVDFLKGYGFFSIKVLK